MDLYVDMSSIYLCGNPCCVLDWHHGIPNIKSGLSSGCGPKSLTSLDPRSCELAVRMPLVEFLYL